MKIAPFYIPKRVLVLKLKSRNARNLQERICISKDLNQSDIEFIENNKNHLAKFAKKNLCQLTFKRGEGLYNNLTIVNIAKKRFTLLDCYSIYRYETKANTFLPNDIENSDKKLTVLKKNIMSLLKPFKNEIALYSHKKRID